MRECRTDVRGIGKPGSHFWSNKSDIVSCSFKQAWRSLIVPLDMAPFECLPSLHTLNKFSWSTNNCSQGFCFKAMMPPPPPTTIAHNAKISCYSLVKILRSLCFWETFNFNFYVYARPFMHCLYFIYASKSYVRYHEIITRQWKFPLRKSEPAFSLT